MKIFINIIDKINFLMKVLIGTFTAAALVVMFWQIVSRYAFNAPLSWSDEFVRYLLVWITFVGAALAVRYSKLIKLDFIFNLFKISNGIKMIIRGLANVLSIIFCLIILRYSLEILEIVHNQKSSSMQIPMSIPYLAIPFGTLMMLLNIIVVWVEGEPESDDGEGLI